METNDRNLKWQFKDELNHPILKVVTHVSGRIDDFVRMVDAYYGGTETADWLHKRSFLSFFLPLAVYIFIIQGPTLLWNDAGCLSWRGGLTAGWLFAGAVVLQVIYFRNLRYRNLMAWLHLGLIATLFLSTWFIAGEDATQASTGLYRHYYGLLAFIAIFVAVPAAWWFRHWKLFELPSNAIEDFRKNFNAKRVVAQDNPMPYESWDVISAFILAVLRTPLHVITFVAIIVLTLPPDHLYIWTLCALALSLLLIAMSSYDPERDAFIRFVRSSFLTGGSLVVTLAIIILAALRIAGVDYVTTLLDAGPNRIILSYIFSTYAIFWLYDFWINQALLDLLGNLNDFKNGSDTIRRHGGGRIAVAMNWNGDRPRMFEPAAFLMRIAQTTRPDSLRESMQKEAIRIEQKFRTFRGVCMVVFATLLILIGWHLHSLDQTPGLTASIVTEESQKRPIFDLPAHLISLEHKPVIMLAASGGGTRAALYTTAVLHGLARLGKLDHLVLASGVSGGSAALAYFAARMPSLVQNDEVAWRQMRETLSSPFIEDVLAGAAEWRIVSRVRLGQLLTESFQRRFLKAGEPGNSVTRTTLGTITDIGLIFNTSLCGSSVLEGSSTLMESAERAGGRLVITNIPSNFDMKPGLQDVWARDFPFEVVCDRNVSLFAAASLSANFPPVFSNAAVALDGKRFWVTDGGAVENRGLISILLVLAEALKRIQTETTDLEKGQYLADIRIIVADASAFQPNYKSDRGMGAKFGASEQLSNRLIKELVARIGALHKAISGRQNGILVIYLPMPDAMRSAGTFGTHWMMPPTVNIKDTLSGDGRRQRIRLTKSEVIEIIDAMFSKEYSVSYIQKRWPELDASRVVEETEKPWIALEAGLQ